jgi:hypothetical protein
MIAIQTTYFRINPLKKDARTNLIVLGVLLAAAGGVLALQSFEYASSIPALLETGQQAWGEALGSMLRSLAVWAVVLGVFFAIWSVTQPSVKYGSEFWAAVAKGLPLGLAMPFLLVLGAGLLIYILLGLLSLLVVEILTYATLQFAGLAAGYLVLIWIVVGMPPLLVAVFRLRKWYYMFIAVVLFIQLTLDIVLAGMSALEILAKNSVWQTNNTAFLLALFGSLLVTVTAVLWSLRGQPVLTVAYAITGIYAAAVVSGNFSERLFHWGEVPAAVLACLAPLAYLQVTKWILRRDGTAVAGLAAGFVGLLAGLFVIRLLHLGIAGQSWFSLLYGVIVVLGLGLILGLLLGRRITRLLARRFQLLPAILRYMDIGQVAGIMAGMFIGGFLVR